MAVGPSEKRVILSPLYVHCLGYLKTKFFPQNAPKPKAKTFGYPFFNNFMLNALKHNYPYLFRVWNDWFDHNIYNNN